MLGVLASMVFAPAFALDSGSVLPVIDEPAQTSAAEQVALCLSAQAKAEQLFTMGRSAANEEVVAFNNPEVKSCLSAHGLLIPSAAQRELISTHLLLNSDFRRGIYSATVNANATRTQQEAMGELGVALEQFMQARAGALRCLQAPEDLISMMAETDLPFATAVIGSRAGVADAQVAQQAAQVLMSKAAVAFEVVEVTHCIGQRDEEFRAYAKHMNQMMEGVHPWAPGCKLSVDGSGSSLTCASYNAPAA